jgi:hypothetical protein
MKSKVKTKMQMQNINFLLQKVPNPREKQTYTNLIASERQEQVRNVPHLLREMTWRLNTRQGEQEEDRAF